MGYLVGNYQVVCNNNHTHFVSGITHDYYCETEGCGIQAVGSGSANILCVPNSHKNWVQGITKSRLCDVCGQTCNFQNTR
jgi:hypothetical protein